MGLSMRNVAIGALLLLGGVAIAFLLMAPSLTLVRSRGSCADLSMHACMHDNKCCDRGRLGDSCSGSTVPCQCSAAACTYRQSAQCI